MGILTPGRKNAHASMPKLSLWTESSMLTDSAIRYGEELLLTTVTTWHAEPRREFSLPSTGLPVIRKVCPGFADIRTQLREHGCAFAQEGLRETREVVVIRVERSVRGVEARATCWASCWRAVKTGECELSCPPSRVLQVPAVPLQAALLL